MPLDAVLTIPSTGAGRSTSLLSRFSSPISKRARNVFDFTIEPEEPYKTYSPDDRVKGHIVLSVLKGFDITHLVIALHGYAKVFKHQSERRPLPEDLVHAESALTCEYLGNGLLSLFRDEHVLCGSGFLKKQIYKFGFELQFPSRSLPTTIDFERGSVSYMISATVTRPTTISPTMTKVCPIQFRDRIDIASMYTPKVRVISLEPINRRGKVKKVKTSSSISTQDAAMSSVRALSRNDTQTSDRSRTAGGGAGNPPLSPAPSEDTVATTTTNSTESMQVVEGDSPVRKPSPQTSETRSSMTSSSTQTITATVELPRHGAIPGDVVPIRVSVTHTKPNARGVVIATLYRTIRVDMYPVIPVYHKGKEKKKEYEDIYPKSKTGLGGLYFASSSPSSVFRKDISQSSTMMIINPATMTADVRTSVKIPIEDALPTMTNIPGGMMSFTYHVEVVIDLAGKFGTKFFSLTNNGPTFTSGVDNGNQLSAQWANNILDTTPLRRAKSVVTSVIPLTVGTKDSAREQRQLQAQSKKNQRYDNNGHYDWSEDMYDPNGYDNDGYWHEDYGYNDNWYGYDENYPGSAPQQYLPPPEQQEEGDEKSRLRRHEELLMPSQPPDSQGSSSWTGTQALAPSAPSAPSLAGSSEVPDTPIAGSSSRPVMASSVSRASARSAETVVPDTITPPPSLPDDENVVPPTEDKQELERRRLMARASAPPDDDGGEGPSGTSAALPFATAPTIDEDEEYISQTLREEHLGGENLPRYRR